MQRISKFIFIATILIHCYQSGTANSYVGIDERLDSVITGPFYLYNEDSVLIDIYGLIDKPTIISFVYYTCNDQCNRLISGISEVMDKSGLRPGHDYQVFTVSINFHDRPSESREIKNKTIEEMDNKLAYQGWHFFTGDSSQILNLAQAAGYGFSKTRNGFAHTIGLIVVSPEKKIVRYMYGRRFIPIDLEMNIELANLNQSEMTVSRNLRYCYSDTPEGRIKAAKYTTPAGIVILVAAILLFLSLVFTPRKGIHAKE